MTVLTATQRLPPLDDPVRRLLWLLPAAIIAWAVLLFVFARMLELSAPPPPELKPIEARIIEVPVGGLQSGGGVANIPAVKAAPPKAIAKPSPPRVVTHPKKVVAPPPSPASALPKKSEEAPAASTTTSGTSGGSAAGPSTNEPASTGEAGSGSLGEGTGGGSGLGSDATGARAIYAPAPVIPDDLREDSFQTEAVARFKVSYEGNVEVSLVTPTPNPRLNKVLLDALQQWRFFPATKSGIAIDAVFEVRIPIAVR